MCWSVKLRMLKNCCVQLQQQRRNHQPRRRRRRCEKMSKRAERANADFLSQLPSSNPFSLTLHKSRTRDSTPPNLAFRVFFGLVGGLGERIQKLLVVFWQIKLQQTFRSCQWCWWWYHYWILRQSQQASIELMSSSSWVIFRNEQHFLTQVQLLPQSKIAILNEIPRQRFWISSRKIDSNLLASGPADSSKISAGIHPEQRNGKTARQH